MIGERFDGAWVSDVEAELRAEARSAVQRGFKLPLYSGDLELTDGIIHRLGQSVWTHLQHQYRYSEADPPQNSGGCRDLIDLLRDLQTVGIVFDVYSCIEVGNEALWHHVYEGTEL